MTAIQSDPCADFNLDVILLRIGGHGDHFTGECCMVEASNRAAACDPLLREKYGAADFDDDHPSISPAIRSFCIAWNDGFPSTAEGDAERTRLLKPYVTKILGTRTNDGDELTRAWMATDWMVRVMAPAWLEKAGCLSAAEALRALPVLTSDEIAVGVQSVIEQAKNEASAAWSAAWSAAESAAESAARSAAWSAARSAAESAARSAAWSAAWSAAESAARSAAKEALRPVVAPLQVSAIDLLERMIAVGSPSGSREAANG